MKCSILLNLIINLCWKRTKQPYHHIIWSEQPPAPAILITRVASSSIRLRGWDIHHEHQRAALLQVGPPKEQDVFCVCTDHTNTHWHWDGGTAVVLGGFCILFFYYYSFCWLETQQHVLLKLKIAVVVTIKSTVGITSIVIPLLDPVQGIDS